MNDHDHAQEQEPCTTCVHLRRFNIAVMLHELPPGIVATVLAPLHASILHHAAEN
jgi:hypothetical protein